jgi:eukaryotic-like serine/threonine-protein kinase
MTAPQSVARVSQAKIGGYPILAKIGAGGMGTVYKGKNPATGQFVAVKVLSGDGASSEVLRLRFAQECQVARRLDHPHIVRVLDFGLDGSRPYLVMEYVEGESLGGRLERGGRLPEAEAVRLIRQAGEALHWAHRRKLIHRDVKPDNILITADGRAKLTDLGLVKNLDGDFNLTRPQSALGTPNFMAPEQFEDARNADARSDLYSLAATLYMAVTGQLPFSGRSAKALATIYKKKLANDLTAPRQLVPELSARLEAEILRALDADRGKRHASVREFIERLPADPQPAAPAAPAGSPGRSGRRKERANRRYASRLGTRCQPLQRAPETSWGGRVLDISQGGLCLELERRYEPGSLLTVLLEGEEVTRRSVVVRVVWVQKDAPKRWTMGCQFDRPLCDDEVQGLR